MVKVEERSADLLTSISSRHVRPGSIIHTDMWKGYSKLNDVGYDHLIINHSQTFKGPVTGVHTNTIEGTWNGLKMQVKPRN